MNEYQKAKAVAVELRIKLERLYSQNDWNIDAINKAEIEYRNAENVRKSLIGYRG